MPGYHSEFVLVPEFQYGIIVLLTGTYTNTGAIVHKAASLFQPAIQTLLQERVNKAYAGRWIGASAKGHEGETAAEMKIINGGLYLTELIVHGYDVLRIIQDADIGLYKPNPVALWSTGRPGEFRFVSSVPLEMRAFNLNIFNRLAFGRKALNNDPIAGCMPYWVSIDNGLYSHGAPIDLVYWDDGWLVYPSAGVRMRHV